MTIVQNDGYLYFNCDGGDCEDCNGGCTCENGYPNVGGTSCAAIGDGVGGCCQDQNLDLLNESNIFH